MGIERCNYMLFAYRCRIFLCSLITALVIWSVQGADGKDQSLCVAVEINDLGVIKWQTGRYEEAFELWKKALAMDPTLEEAYINIGLYLEQNRDWSKLKKYARRMISNVPGSPAAFAALGHALYRLREYERAIPMLQRAIYLSEQKPGNLERLFPEALEEIRRLIRRCEIRTGGTR